ncbi:MAG: hypothetical protein LBC75_08070 [Fibromonadaceae bacterium]|nr:hypothetical protein [Fibromonadaceae bacterium]
MKGHEEYHEQRQAKQKEAGWPCLELYTKDDPHWIYNVRCDSCEEYEVDISKWKTTDDVKALLGQKCPKCGKEMLTEKSFAKIYDTAESIHTLSSKIIMKLWNLLAPKKWKKLMDEGSVYVVDGKLESLRLGEIEIKL